MQEQHRNWTSEKPQTDAAAKAGPILEAVECFFNWLQHSGMQCTRPRRVPTVANRGKHQQNPDTPDGCVPAGPTMPGIVDEMDQEDSEACDEALVEDSAGMCSMCKASVAGSDGSMRVSLLRSLPSRRGLASRT